MKTFLRILSASLLATAGLGFIPAAHAEEAKGSDLAMVEAAKGVMVRVPVDASGRELEEQAEMRLHDGAAVTNADELLRAWNESVPAVNSTDDGIATERRGWGRRGWGWGGRGRYGWGHGRRFFGWPFFFGPFGYYRYGAPYYRPYYYGDDCDDDDDCKTNGNSNYYYYPSLGFKAYQ